MLRRTRRLLLKASLHKEVEQGENLCLSHCGSWLKELLFCGKTGKFNVYKNEKLRATGQLTTLGFQT